MFPKCSQKHILTVSLNMLKEGVFKDIKKGFKNARYYGCCSYSPQLFTSIFFCPIFEFPNLGK